MSKVGRLVLSYDGDELLKLTEVIVEHQTLDAYNKARTVCTDLEIIDAAMVIVGPAIHALAGGDDANNDGSDAATGMVVLTFLEGLKRLADPNGAILSDKDEPENTTDGVEA